MSADQVPPRFLSLSIHLSDYAGHAGYDLGEGDWVAWLARTCEKNHFFTGTDNFYEYVAVVGDTIKQRMRIFIFSIQLETSQHDEGKYNHEKKLHNPFSVCHYNIHFMHLS